MMITKQFKASDMSINKSKREVVAKISTADPDRDNEVVLPSGLKKGVDYGGRPMLWSHNYDIPPVGSLKWVKNDGDSLIAKYCFSKATALACELWELQQEGHLSAHSIGFDPLQFSPPSAEEKTANPSWANVGNVHRLYEVVECSLCSVPANPNALVIAKSFCPETKAILGWVDGDELFSDWETVEPPQEKKIILPVPKFFKTMKEHKREQRAKHNARERMKEKKYRELVARLLNPSEVMARLRGIV